MDSNNIRIVKRKDIDHLSKTCISEYENAFGYYHGVFEDMNIFLEFWIGRKFIGCVIGSKCENALYIDRLFINDSIQKSGYGKKIVDILKEDYSIMVVESIDEAVGFYRKCGFKRTRDQDYCEYVDTVYMKYTGKKKRKRESD